MVDAPTQRIHPEPPSYQSFPVFRSLDEKPKSRIERVLSVTADVRAGEGVIALMMTASIFFLLGVVPLYGWFASKVKRARLLASLTGFFSANLVVCRFPRST
jgi:hypothetical protein